MAQRTVTIYDIAKEAHVSPATVSRIITNSSSVRQEKRDRVLEAIEKHHFKPNALARGLSETHSRRLGMICPDIRNPFYANVYTECERAACDRGYTLLFNNTFGREDQEIVSISRMLEQRVDSLIISGGIIDWCPMPEKFRAVFDRCCSEIPVIVNGYLPGYEKKCSQYVIDSGEGMRQAVTYLASLGHQRIAFLHGYEHIYQTRVKKKAFQETMQDLGLPVRDAYLVNGGLFNKESGYAGMNQLLKLDEPPTGIIAINDLMAAGALQALQKLGYSVPKEFSLIGFDDCFLTELTQPNITSVHCDYSALGNTLVDAAIRAVNGEPAVDPVFIPTSLTIRESCGRPINI